MRMNMIILYIIGGFLGLIVAIYLLDRREKMSEKIKEIKEQKKEIEAINQQLDELQYQLDVMEEPIQKANQISSQILFYMKK